MFVYISRLIAKSENNSVFEAFISGVVRSTIFFFSSRRRHTRFDCDWSSDVCSSDLDSMAKTLSIRLGEKRYMLGERSILLSVCVGTAVCKNNEDWNQLLRDGRAAMERARSQGRGRFVKFEPSADGPMQEQLLLEQDFRSAIGTSQLFMAYQPICHVATGKISGFESLMRWNSPARGSVPPGVFIPMAERRGLLLPIDQMVERSQIGRASCRERV